MHLPPRTRHILVLLAAAFLLVGAAGGPAAAAGPREYAYIFFQGKLTSDDGSRPLRDVTVRLTGGGETFETRTDDTGAFVFERLPVRDYAVILLDAEGRTIRDVRELSLGDPGRKRLRVRLDQGDPAPIRLDPGDDDRLRIDVPPPRTRWSRLWKQGLIFLGAAALLAA